MIPTFKEYEHNVKVMLYNNLKRCADADELREYLDSDTVNDLIKTRYPDDVDDYKNGKFPDISWAGAERSAAYCLYLMF